MFPKSFGHTPGWAGTTPGTTEGADKRGITQVFIGRPVCWNQPTPTWGPEGVQPGSPCPRQINHAVGTATGGEKEKEQLPPTGRSWAKARLVQWCRTLLGRFQSWKPAVRQGPISTRKWTRGSDTSAEVEVHCEVGPPELKTWRFGRPGPSCPKQIWWFRQGWSAMVR